MADTDKAGAKKASKPRRLTSISDAITALQKLHEQSKLTLDRVTEFLEEFVANGGETAAGKKRARDKAKKERDPDMPKRPPTGYLLFVKEARPLFNKTNADGSKVSQKDMMTSLGSAWKSLSDEERGIFNARADAAKEEYKELMEEYNRKHPAKAVAVEEEYDDEEDGGHEEEEHHPEVEVEVEEDEEEEAPRPSKKKAAASASSKPVPVPVKKEKKASR